MEKAIKSNPMQFLDDGIAHFLSFSQRKVKTTGNRALENSKGNLRIV